MQYALLIYSGPGAGEALSAAEREANHREYMDIKKLPGVVGGASPCIRSRPPPRSASRTG